MSVSLTVTATMAAVGSFSVTFLDHHSATKHCLLYAVSGGGVTLRTPRTVYDSLQSFAKAHASKLKYRTNATATSRSLAGATPSRARPSLTALAWHSIEHQVARADDEGGGEREDEARRRCRHPCCLLFLIIVVLVVLIVLVARCWRREGGDRPVSRVHGPARRQCVHQLRAHGGLFGLRQQAQPHAVRYLPGAH